MLSKTNKTAASILTLLSLLFFSIAPAAAETLKLGQTSVVIGRGQGITLVSFNSNDLTAKSNSSAVKVTVNGGNQISILGMKTGRAKVTVCSDILGCRTVTVKVQRNKVPLLRFDQQNVSIAPGESVAVAYKNGKHIVALSNSASALTYIDGPYVVVSGNATGTATITVCSSNLGCEPIYVTVSH